MSSKTQQFVFAGSGPQRLVVQTEGRVRPDSTDADDSHWVHAVVEVCAGAFAGAIKCSIRTDDLAEFREQLGKLVDGSAASASFKTMEDQLGIEVASDGHGPIGVVGHVADGIHGNRLQFRFASDRTGIAQALREIDAVLQEYPVA